MFNIFKRKKYVVFRLDKGQYFNGITWNSDPGNAMQLTKTDATTLALAFLYTGISAIHIEKPG